LARHAAFMARVRDGHAKAAWRFGVRVREYRELEAGTRFPTFETWDRICKAVRVA
jgi:hypothetical protein